MVQFSEAEVRSALWEVDRLQAALDRAQADQHNYKTWQERTVRAENVYRASHDLFVMLDRLERSGLLLYSEILAANAAKDNLEQNRIAS